MPIECWRGRLCSRAKAGAEGTYLGPGRNQCLGLAKRCNVLSANLGDDVDRMKKIDNLLPTLFAIAGISFVFWNLNAEPNSPSPTPPGDDFARPLAHAPGEPFRLYGGKVDQGKEAFENLNCIQCHKVNGFEVAAPKGKRRLELTLGGELRFVKRYEDLLLAITNPRHVINEQYRAILSKAELNGAIEPMMPDLTDHMTARQLVDLVTFLDAAYAKSQIDYKSPE